jgi:hypothetical protein
MVVSVSTASEVTTSLYGRPRDRYGRKMVLTVSTVVLLIGTVDAFVRQSRTIALPTRRCETGSQ